MKDLYTIVVLMGVGIMLALIIVEWVVGCGNVTYYPDGTWIENECVFIKNELVHGLTY